MAGEVENIAISAFNYVVVEVEAELGNTPLFHHNVRDNNSVTTNLASETDVHPWKTLINPSGTKISDF